MKCLSQNQACEDGYWKCGTCSRRDRARAFRQLTPEQKDYDRYVDPLSAYHTEFPRGCSCHICAPCSFCVNQKPDEEETKP